MPPRISLIIPVYNAAHFLPNCLDIVFAEEGSIEVIAVDDASTDDSTSVLDDYAHRFSNLTIVRFPRNRGVSAARNAGIERARGDYLMFCDPDDSFVPGALEYVQKLVSSSDNSPDVVFFKHKSVSEQLASIEPNYDAPVQRFNMKDEKEALVCFPRLFTLLWAWNGAFKRSVVGSFRFDETLWPFEDILWGVQCTCRCSSVLETDAVLYRYHQHSASCLHRIFFSRVRSELEGTAAFYWEAKKWRYYEKSKPYVFSRLNFRAFNRSTELIESLIPEEKAKAWAILFSSYEPVFRDLTPGWRRHLYVFALNHRSRFLVKYAIAYPIRIKDALLNFGIRKRIKAALSVISRSEKSS